MEKIENCLYIDIEKKQLYFWTNSPFWSKIILYKNLFLGAKRAIFSNKFQQKFN